MQLEFRAVPRIDIFCTGSYNQRQTSEFISACNCSIRHEHQREGGNGIPLVLVPFSFYKSCGIEAEECGDAGCKGIQ